MAGIASLRTDLRSGSVADAYVLRRHGFLLLSALKACVLALEVAMVTLGPGSACIIAQMVEGNQS